MQRYLLAASILVVPLLCAGCLSDDSAEDVEAGRTTFFKHGPPSGGAPYAYQLTSYGGAGDSSTGTPACGGKSVDGTWYYATGAYTFGCHSKLKLEANGTCVVVEAVDNGPAASVETKAAKKCGGTGYIIDASPLVSKALFGSTSAGWSDCFEIQVTPMPSTTPSGPISCSAAGSDDEEETTPPDTQSYCGDGILDSGELCDSGIPDGDYGACPVVCDGGEPCLQGQVVGSGCEARCQYTNICPEDTCGNGTLDSGELCDTGIYDGYVGACPWDCDDDNPCTSDELVGSGCKVMCLYSNTCP